LFNGNLVLAPKTKPLLFVFSLTLLFSCCSLLLLLPLLLLLLLPLL
jgi:hypothetical protein